MFKRPHDGVHDQLLMGRWDIENGFKAVCIHGLRDIYIYIVFRTLGIFKYIHKYSDIYIIRYINIKSEYDSYIYIQI